MNVGVVLVTFNRANKLIIALESYEKQLRKPQYIIVVNNNSTDGTKEILSDWSKTKSKIEKHVINLGNNIGGSGGFNEGLKLGMKLEADWIWVADDDAYPEQDAINNLEDFYKNLIYKHKSEIVALCGTVINNNKIDTMHRRRIKNTHFNIIEEPVELLEYRKDYFEIDLFSYVGSVMNKKYLAKTGLTEKGYFIYYDDTEHSFRLRKEGRILCVPNVKIFHNAEVENSSEISWKKYYLIRNRLLFYRKHFRNRYFILIYTKQILKIYVKKLIGYGNPVFNEMALKALHDAKNNKSGLDDIYKPGWRTS